MRLLSVVAVVVVAAEVEDELYLFLRRRDAGGCATESAENNGEVLYLSTVVRRWVF